LFPNYMCCYCTRLTDVWFLSLSAKARARIELREEATEQDARDVIEIMKYR